MAEAKEIVYVPVPGYCDEWNFYVTREGDLYRRRSYKNGTEKYVKIGSKCKNNGYIKFGISNKGIVMYGKVHVFIAKTFIPNPENKPFVDHINGNRSDNRIENLRWCTSFENSCNKKKQENTSSSFKGVSWDKSRDKWMSYVFVDKRMKFLGYFTDEEDAARAYDKAAREHYGEYAKLNFPDDIDDD